MGEKLSTNSDVSTTKIKQQRGFTSWMAKFGRGKTIAVLLFVLIFAGAGGYFVFPSKAAGVADGQGFGPVLIVSADAGEQNAVLADMKITGHGNIGPYAYDRGTIDGHPVIDVRSHEAIESTTLATQEFDQAFHPEFSIWVGTSGANMADLHVGDVVVGNVVDKTELHYHDQSELAGAPSDFQTDYDGVDIYTGPGTLTAGAIGAHDAGGGWESVDGLAGDLQLAQIAQQAKVGSVSVADATGDSSKTGTVPNKVLIGTEGSCGCWTEPLADVSAQNATLPSDVEANEGMGFGMGNAETGTPWLNIRDVSDSPWEPNAYDATLSDAHGALVVRYVIDHLPNHLLSTAPITLNDLSTNSAARQYGYQVAGHAFYTITPVTRIDDANGTTMPQSKLNSLVGQYQFGKDGL